MFDFFDWGRHFQATSIFCGVIKAIFGLFE